MEAQIDKWIICRICLKHSANAMRKIFDPEADCDWANKIEQCGGVCLDPGADLPESMCGRCELLLRAAHKFRLLCQRSQEQLVELLQLRAGATLPKDQEEMEAHTKSNLATIISGTRYIVKEEQNSPSESDVEQEEHIDEGEGGEGLIVEEPDEEDQKEDVLEEVKVDYNDADMVIEEQEEDDETLEQVDCEYIELPHDQLGFIQDDSSQNPVSDEMSNTSYPNEQHFHIVEEIEADSVNSNEDAASYEATLESTAMVPEVETLIKTLSGCNKRKRQSAQQQSADDCELIQLNDGGVAIQLVQKFSVTKLRSPTVRKRRTQKKREPAETAGVTKAMNAGKQPQEEQPTFICCHCGNMYNERAKLTLHMKNHQSNKEKPHECEICHKRFTQTPQLARHMNSHTGKKPFKCKFCPASFADPSTCIKHQRIHTNERPYKCDTCGKSFTYSNVLKVHMMIHTGEKPFSCVHCDKKFSQLHHKKAHERSHNQAEMVLKLDEDSLDLQ